MAWVFFPDQWRQHTQGLDRIWLQAENYRELEQALIRRFPGIKDLIDDQVTVAINDEIIHDPLLESVGAESEIHFLPKINAG